MIALKKCLWGFLWMPQSHVRRKAVEGTSQNQVLSSALPTTSGSGRHLAEPGSLLCSPHYLPGARIKPGCALALAWVSGGCSAAPHVASTAPTACSGKDPGPQNSFGGPPDCRLPAPRGTVSHPTPSQLQAPSTPSPLPVLCPEEGLAPVPSP